MAVLMGRNVRDKILTAHRDNAALAYRRSTYGALPVVISPVLALEVKEKIVVELYKAVVSNNEP